jgi:Flp pilus assembly protein TadD
LLSAHLSAGQLNSFVSELGDRGQLDVLDRLFVRLTRFGDTPGRHEVAEGIRDASIDLDSIALAVRVQALIVSWRPTHAPEWRRLGELRSQSGDDEGARAALARSLELRPADPKTAAQWQALQAGDPLVSENMVPSRRALRQYRLKAFDSLRK